MPTQTSAANLTGGQYTYSKILRKVVAATQAQNDKNQNKKPQIN
nr:hypothetical protein [uncultured Campylobacter sp.]